MPCVHEVVGSNLDHDVWFASAFSEIPGDHHRSYRVWALNGALSRRLAILFREPEYILGKPEA